MKAFRLITLTVLVAHTFLHCDAVDQTMIRRNLAVGIDDIINQVKVSGNEDDGPSKTKPGPSSEKKNDDDSGGAPPTENDGSKGPPKPGPRGDVTGEIDNEPDREQKPKKDVVMSTMVTPTLWVRHPDGLACNLSNVGSGTRSARLYILSNGKILADSGNFLLEPMHTKDIAIGGLDQGGPLYCGESSAMWSCLYKTLARSN